MRRTEPTPDELDEAIEDIIENDKSDRAKEKYTMVNKKEETAPGRSPVHTLVSRLGDTPDEFKTTVQVAEELDVSESTVRRAAKDKEAPGPSNYVKMGEMMVAVYTADDIVKLGKYLEKRRRIIPAEEVNR